MEEIVGSEAIQGEILEDARKKAARILEDAEAEAARNVAATEAKAAAVVDEIVRTNEAKSARFRMETMARFPLERTRMRTSFVDGALRAAMNEYMAELPEPRVAELAAAMLERASSFFAGEEVELLRRGVSEAAARSAADRALPGAAALSHAEDPSLPAVGLVARARGGGIVARATMDLVQERLLDERRAELASALCAGALEL